MTRPTPPTDGPSGAGERCPGVTTAVSADTITDEQIRELLNAGAIDRETHRRARFLPRWLTGPRKDARERCAAAWNACTGATQ